VEITKRESTAAGLHHLAMTEALFLQACTSAQHSEVFCILWRSAFLRKGGEHFSPAC